MLYERWRQVVRENADSTALWDVQSGRHWSFSAFESWAEKAEGVRPGERVYPTGTGAEFVREVLRGWRAEVPVCPLDEGQQRAPDGLLPEGCVHLKTTSATTGQPRFVAFRPAQLLADVDNIKATMNLRPGLPNLAGISLAHSYGFSNLVLPLLLHGIPLVLCGSGLPEAIRRGATQVPACTLPGIPVLWRHWHEAAAIPDNVGLAISAGASLPRQLEQDIFDKCGLKVHNFYGASECGGIAYDGSESPRLDDACVGVALSGVNLALDPDGHLEVRSKAVGETYWPQREPQLQAGVYRTTDLAELAGGEVLLRGRAADLIHVAGRKVSPETIERCLAAHPQVRECLIVGLPAPEGSLRGDLVAAVVVVDHSVGDQELRDFLWQRLPDWQVPKVWHRVASLEVNQRGKHSRAAWRRRLLRASDSTQ